MTAKPESVESVESVVAFGDGPLPSRFWSKATVEENGCWVWRGRLNNGGYGRYSQGGKEWMAHRVAYEALVGPITEETLDHLCKNRPCINPAHLEPVSIRENTLRGTSWAAQNARKTHCKRGHPLSGFNLQLNNGTRQCRACKNLWGSRRHTSQGRKVRAVGEPLIVRLPIPSAVRGGVECSEGNYYITIGFDTEDKACWAMDAIASSRRRKHGVGE